MDFQWGFWSPQDREWAARADASFVVWNETSEERESAAGATIPRRIHQIWLGGPIPKRFQRLRDTWLALHPDYEHILWTDETIGTLPLYNAVSLGRVSSRCLLSPGFQAKFAAASNPGEQSDILRYEILFLLGGVYIDVDVAAVGSLDSLLSCCGLFAGVSNTKAWELNNAVMGCAVGHPMLARLMSDVKHSGCAGDWSGPMATIASTGPGRLTSTLMTCLCDGSPPVDVPADVLDWAAAAGLAFLAAGGATGSSVRSAPASTVILPREWFYPLPNSTDVDPPPIATSDEALAAWKQAVTAAGHRLRDLTPFLGPEVSAALTMNSIGVHFWARSWQRKGAVCARQEPPAVAGSGGV